MTIEKRLDALESKLTPCFTERWQLLGKHDPHESDEHCIQRYGYDPTDAELHFIIMVAPKNVGQKI